MTPDMKIPLQGLYKRIEWLKTELGIQKTKSRKSRMKSQKDKREKNGRRKLRDSEGPVQKAQYPSIKEINKRRTEKTKRKK